MIVINSITVKEFRGIRKHTLALNGKSFAICGANGTGKSGIVDAIEFVLTGNISRLTGDGRGDLSILKHAPHVDSRETPDSAEVSAEVFIPSLNKTATIVRTVKRARTPAISPQDPDVLRVFREVSEHPECVLSRRELVQYVLATPSKRAAEVSALLHLDRVGLVRQSLTKVSNADLKSAGMAKTVASEVKTKLITALGVSVFSVESAIQATNVRRAILQLPPLTELTAVTSLKDGVQSMPTTPTAKPLSKQQAQADCARLRQLLSQLASPVSSQLRVDARAAVEGLQHDPLVLDGVQREQFVTLGLKLIADERCPFCDTIWQTAELTQHVQEKVTALEASAKKRAEVEQSVVPTVELAVRLGEALVSASQIGSRLPAPLPLQAVVSQRAAVEKSAKALRDFMSLEATLAGLAALDAVGPAVAADLQVLEAAIAQLPELSSADAARDWLSVAQVCLENYRDAKRREQAAQEQARISKATVEIYMATADGVLGGIFRKVQDDFAALYAAINPKDEGKFKATLEHSEGGLGLSVDFYQKGEFPPGAYHSEGHQDGMGLCLYLALMRHLQGANFRFAVLDDVLMSVDVGHRREVCRLLKDKFPNTQFILTTHDKIWMRHMKTEGVIGSQSGVYFRSWDVERGPSEWEAKDVWDEIDEALKHDNVAAAAGALRNYLEFVAAEYCHSLRAQVEFRGDAQYQLGDLLPSAIGRMKKLLALAKATAQSWGKGDQFDALKRRDEDFSAALQAAQEDQWQVNAAIHFNSWDNLSAGDFAPVAAAMKTLVAHFSCQDCGGMYRVEPERGEQGVLRCDCEAVNLKKKPADNK